MGIFSNPDEVKRKANLKAMENKRLAFAEKLAAQGFAPGRMLFVQLENGGYAALCRAGGQRFLIVAPGFGTQDDFEMEALEALHLRAQRVHVAGDGLGGIFGMGKKPEIGVEYWLGREVGEVKLSFVGGRGGWRIFPPEKNPLTSLKRRRGDANVVWDLDPLDNSNARRAIAAAEAFFREECGWTGEMAEE